MALLALIVLLATAFTGLAVGRWRMLGAALPAVPACAVLFGTEAGLVAVLGLAGLTAGVHLHRVVADTAMPRPGRGVSLR